MNYFRNKYVPYKKSNRVFSSFIEKKTTGHSYVLRRNAINKLIAT